MKSILNLVGVQKLSRTEQEKIKGSQGSRISCCGLYKCRITFSNGNSICEPGSCRDGGRCIIF